MSRTSLQDTSGLPDPLLSYNFDLIIPSVPGGGSGRGLTLRCKSSVLPGAQLEQVTAGLHGVEVNYAGRQIWTKTFTATFVETRDVEVRNRILAWIKFARDNKNNSGNYKAGYAVDVVMLLYDDIPNVVKECTIVKVFPLSLEDATMDGSQGQLVEISVNFSYDYVDE